MPELATEKQEKGDLHLESSTRIPLSKTECLETFVVNLTKEMPLANNQVGIGPVT